MPYNRTAFTQNIPFRFERCRDIRMHKLGLLPASKTQIDAGVVGIGDIMPDALMLDASYTDDGIGDQIEHPVQIVRPPVIEDTARDWFVRVPVITGMGIATNKRLHVEDRPDRLALE